MRLIIEFLSACLTLSRDRTNRQSLNWTCTETFSYHIFGPESWLHLSSSHQLCSTKAESTLQQTRWSCKKRNVPPVKQSSIIPTESQTWIPPGWLRHLIVESALRCFITISHWVGAFVRCRVGSRRSESSKWECFCLIKCRPCGKIMNQCL